MGTTRNPIIQYKNTKQFSWEHCYKESNELVSKVLSADADMKMWDIKFLVGIDGVPKNLHGSFIAPISRYIKPILMGNVVFGLN